MVHNISMDLISILNSFENIIIFNIYVWIETICEYIWTVRDLYGNTL